MLPQRLLQFIRGGFHLEVSVRRRQTKHTFGFAELTQLAMMRELPRQSVQLKRCNNFMPNWP